MPDPPPELPPWFWDRASRLLAEPEFVHTDACSWMGEDSAHPCTCRVPALLRAVAERVDLSEVARAVDPPLDIEHSFDYVDHVQPDQPLPDVTSTITPPAKDAIDTWTLAWTAVRFRTHGTWAIGVVKGKIRLHDGTWILEIEHAHQGMHPGWKNVIWAVYDARLIVPIDTEPPAAREDASGRRGA